MIKFIVLIFLISINFAHGKCGKWIYALPGDTYWPSEEAFLSLRANIIGNVIIKGDKNFTPHTWSTLNNVPRPAVIVQPKELNDIIVALKFARHYNIRVSVQSTGHQMDRRNIYDNSVLVDMSTMNSLSYNSAKKTLTTGPGNTFANIQKYLASITNKTYVALCGADPSVGIYGWSVGGGHGALTRLYGLGVDALLSIDLILANFTIITANSTHNAALYRALRGSGGGAYLWYSSKFNDTVISRSWCNVNFYRYLPIINRYIKYVCYVDRICTLPCRWLLCSSKHRFFKICINKCALLF